MTFKQWLYRGGHPNRLAKILNRGWAIIHRLGVAPNYLVTLEVVGRQSGKVISSEFEKIAPQYPVFRVKANRKVAS